MSTLVAQTISNGTVSTSSANVIQGSAKAWCNYNLATQTIRASYNVSSVTYHSTGAFTINFTNAFADNNYAWSLGAGNGDSTAYSLVGGLSVAPTTTSLRLYCYSFGGSPANPAFNSVSIFR